MKAILFVAHGSRDAGANQHAQQLTDCLRQKLVTYDLIECAFLELAEPDIAAGIKNLIQNNAKEIHLLPYFLTPGNHVTKDIDAIISTIQFPEEISIQILPYFGAAKGLDNLILNHISQNPP